MLTYTNTIPKISDACCLAKYRLMLKIDVGLYLNYFIVMYHLIETYKNNSLPV